MYTKEEEFNFKGNKISEILHSEIGDLILSSMFLKNIFCLTYLLNYEEIQPIISSNRQILSNMKIIKKNELEYSNEFTNSEDRFNIEFKLEDKGLLCSKLDLGTQMSSLIFDTLRLEIGREGCMIANTLEILKIQKVRNSYDRFVRSLIAQGSFKYQDDNLWDFTLLLKYALQITSPSIGKNTQRLLNLCELDILELQKSYNKRMREIFCLTQINLSKARIINPPQSEINEKIQMAICVTYPKNLCVHLKTVGGYYLYINWFSKKLISVSCQHLKDPKSPPEYLSCHQFSEPQYLHIKQCWVKVPLPIKVIKRKLKGPLTKLYRYKSEYRVLYSIQDTVPSPILEYYKNVDQSDNYICNLVKENISIIVDEVEESIIFLKLVHGKLNINFENLQQKLDLLAMNYKEEYLKHISMEHSTYKLSKYSKKTFKIGSNIMEIQEVDDNIFFQFYFKDSNRVEIEEALEQCKSKKDDTAFEYRLLNINSNNDFLVKFQNSKTAKFFFKRIRRMRNADLQPHRIFKQPVILYNEEVVIHPTTISFNFCWKNKTPEIQNISMNKSIQNPNNKFNKFYQENTPFVVISNNLEILEKYTNKLKLKFSDGSIIFQDISNLTGKFFCYQLNFEFVGEKLEETSISTKFELLMKLKEFLMQLLQVINYDAIEEPNQAIIREVDIKWLDKFQKRNKISRTESGARKSKKESYHVQHPDMSFSLDSNISEVSNFNFEDGSEGKEMGQSYEQAALKLKNKKNYIQNILFKIFPSFEKIPVSQEFFNTDTNDKNYMNLTFQIDDMVGISKNIDFKNFSVKFLKEHCLRQNEILKYPGDDIYFTSLESKVYGLMSYELATGIYLNLRDIILELSSRLKVHFYMIRKATSRKIIFKLKKLDLNKIKTIKSEMNGLLQHKYYSEGTDSNLFDHIFSGEEGRKKMAILIIKFQKKAIPFYIPGLKVIDIYGKKTFRRLVVRELQGFFNSMINQKVISQLNISLRKFTLIRDQIKLINKNGILLKIVEEDRKVQASICYYKIDSKSTRFEDKSAAEEQIEDFDKMITKLATADWSQPQDESVLTSNYKKQVRCDNCLEYIPLVELKRMLCSHSICKICAELYERRLMNELKKGKKQLMAANCLGGNAKRGSFCSMRCEMDLMDFQNVSSFISESEKRRILFQRILEAK